MQALFSHSSPSVFCSSCIEDQVTIFLFLPKMQTFQRRSHSSSFTLSASSLEIRFFSIYLLSSYSRRLDYSQLASVNLGLLQFSTLQRTLASSLSNGSSVLQSCHTSRQSKGFCFLWTFYRVPPQYFKRLYPTFLKVRMSLRTLDPKEQAQKSISPIYLGINYC